MFAWPAPSRPRCSHRAGLSVGEIGGGASLCSGGEAGLDDDTAKAQVDGELSSAAQYAELLTQLDSSRLFLALYGKDGALPAHRTVMSASGTAPAGTSAAPAKPPTPTTTTRTPPGPPRSATCAATAAPTTD